MDKLAEGRRVFDIEIEALKKTRDALDETIVKILDEVTGCKGKVVITGMGTVNPVGNSIPESWAAVKASRCGIGPITRYDTADMKVKLAGEVKNLDLDALLGKREADRKSVV